MAIQSSLCSLIQSSSWSRSKISISLKSDSSDVMVRSLAMQSIGKSPKEHFMVSGYFLDCSRILRFVLGFTPELMTMVWLSLHLWTTWSRSLSNCLLSRCAWTSMYFITFNSEL